MTERMTVQEAHSARPEDQAHQVAEGHRVSQAADTSANLLDRLSIVAEVLRDAYGGFARASEKGGTLSGVAEWVLDNYYVIQKALRLVREDMPQGYYRRLPKLEESSLRGYPRVYAIAGELIRAAAGQVSVDTVERFVRGYQDVHALTMGEVWAVPTLLRLGVLELLARTVADAAGIALSIDGMTWFDPEAFQGRSDEEVVAAAVNSLRAIDDHEWNDFFETVSLVEEALRRDPVGVYPLMDFDTRDRYRSVVEELAQTTEQSEQEVARAALRLARQQAGKTTAAVTAPSWSRPRREHVGFYLIDEGRGKLEESVGFRPGRLGLVRRWGINHPALVYLTGITLATGIALAGAVAYTRIAGGGVWAALAVSVLALVPASLVGVNLTNVIVTRAAAPHVLPKLDFGAGIPRACRTMVVVPALLSGEDQVETLLHQLELHFQGNPDRELGFALLGDFTDAPEQHMPDDADLVEQARNGIRQLNAKYRGKPNPSDEAGPFFFFHRERLWNPREGCWMGWERKRGKLMEFNRLLRGEGETSYVVKMGHLSFLSEVKYVITLDADTVFPLDAGHRLVGTLAHPLNQAEFVQDERKGKAEGGDVLVSGYTVLQPRTEVKPTAVTQTWFTRIYAGDAGVDLYTRAVSDVYQDLFGVGIYTGKGIYDVDAFERSLRRRVPENALLSHDLFEGMHGRAALVTDIVLFEDYPPTFLSYARRKHRWVRGDWQILPWLLPRVPHAGEGRLPNRLSILDRWKILDNLRRSVRAPAFLALFLAGWFLLPGSPIVWTVAAAGTYGLPLVAGAATEVARRLTGGRTGPPTGTLLVGLAKEAARWALNVAFLPYESILMADAIITTVARLLISRKRLLQWTTAAHTVRLFGRESEIGLVWRQMGGGPALAVAFAVALAFFRPTVLPLAAPFLLSWLVSPLLAAWIGRPQRQEKVTLSDQELRRLRLLARRTWLYFERFVGPDDHWLPPDHFQEEPRGAVAHRTSPTNIGLMLLSSLAAYDLGYIGLMELLLRVGDALDSMDRMERHRGHLLNWYDTRTLEPLQPRYVSTVDSGNLAGCLMALRQGLKGVERERSVRGRRWQGLSDTLGVLGQSVAKVGEETAVAEAAKDLQLRIDVVREEVLSAKVEPERWVSLLTRLEDEIKSELFQRLQALLDSGSEILDTRTVRDVRLWSERVHMHLLGLRREMETMQPWAFFLDDVPDALLGEELRALNPAIAETWHNATDRLPGHSSLEELGLICREARKQLEELRQILKEELETAEEGPGYDLPSTLEEVLRWSGELDRALDEASTQAADTMRDLDGLGQRAANYVEEMGFGFLYDDQRDVFHIGYQVDSEELDRNHYDLLASEARIASAVAIGKREVPQRHWLHLGRPLSSINGLRTLLSWGGSMFEYLMPNLLMRSYRATLLNQANRAAVEGQIAYALERGVPWGISESGYYRLDAQLNYQYRGFGMPGLGRKRGLGNDLVIAPYASVLAVGLAPRMVLENVEALVAEGMQGHYGLYEAVDFTESRLPMGQRKAVVRSYMAHHQGMILVALTNYLNGESIVDWFHRDPRVRSVELLLQERIPHGAPLEEKPDNRVGVERVEREEVKLEPWEVALDAPLPQVHLLSNGRYGTVITEAGSGYSSYVANGFGVGEALALTRWRADSTRDCWGMWIYAQDLEAARASIAPEGVHYRPWAVAGQPTQVPPDQQQVRFYPHQAEFRRRYDDISLHTEITVTPKDDVEIRRVTLTNHGDRRRLLRVSSYAEVVLTDQRSDRQHPAFSKMFVESEYVGDLNALIFRRRSSSTDEPLLYMAHALVIDAGLKATGAHESDRNRFVGRGRTARDPVVLTRTDVDEWGGAEWLSGTTGATLDPILALGQDVELPPHTVTELAYLTSAAPSREETVRLIRHYRSWSRIDRAFDEAHAQSQVELGNLDLEASDVRDLMRLLSVLLYPHRSLRADPNTLAANRLGQAGLWRYGISGDYPMILVRIADEEGMPLIRDLMRAHAYWRNRRLKVDLVILNERDVGYAQELSEQLNRVIARLDGDAWLNRRGGIFMLRAGQMEETERLLLQTAARAVLDASQGTLHRQLDGVLERPSRLPSLQPSETPDQREPMPMLTRPDDLRFDNGFGGFSADGREYVVYLDTGSRPDAAGAWTPAPWINVVANPVFGFLTSDTGLGYSWAYNSGENRLTPWRNDPVSDSPAEALYLRDEETADVWTPTPLPAGGDAPYIARHGAGYSIFQHNSHGLLQRLQLFAASSAPVKVVRLRLENTWDRTRRITATYYVEWVLGTTREETQQYVISEYDSETTALLARNPYNEDHGERVAFLVASKEAHGLTADRTEFLGRNGDMRHPAALDRVGLEGAVGPGIDPCGAIQIHLDLEQGEVLEIHFLVGQGEDRKHALDLIRRYRDEEEVAAVWKEVRAHWDALLERVTVDTPDPAMDLLLNRWLLYQALSCRVWGRSALYQSSGAYGFRDQLQDVMALFHAAPALAREHILRAARHQFEEGDVLHWWHPPSDRGVRTRISDDLLWLPYVTAEYVQATGERSILDEAIPFRKGKPLESEEEERYGNYGLTEEKATLYEHCLRAIHKGSTEGARGLPLIGAGDWNDGLNRVGIEGHGESVWVGWFLFATLTRFVSICEKRGDSDQATAFRKRAETLQKALDEAWDGEWYLRATYDDGTPLGSSQGEECKIASIAQSWAVLSGAARGERADQAMASVAERLLRMDAQIPAGLLMLFTPPFDETRREPGYIKAYPPGIRENGGQYTHAAIWAVWAYTALGHGDRAGQLFRLLNPILRSDTREKARRYHVEPYVVAADVYGSDQHLGKGGWTWYTGSAGWMFRLGLEAILGLRREGDAFRVEPCIPKDWPSYQMTYRPGETVYWITVENPQGVCRGVKSVSLDEQVLPSNSIPLLDDAGRHEVRIVMG